MSVIRLYRYLCTEYGMIGKRDYTAALGHNFQKIVIHEASYDTLGKVLEICSFETSVSEPTCTSSGYIVREC